MQEHATIKCLNCDAPLVGRYCSECGQKASVQKLTWQSILEEVVHFFTHAEHSFIYTTQKLITSPGIVVKEFLDGKRKKVHKPITFLLIWLAILRLLTGFLKICVEKWHMYQFPKTASVFRILWTGPKNQHLLDYENLIDIFIQAPILILVGWGVFRKTKNTFVESWVAVIYATGFTFIIQFVIELLIFVFRLLHLPLTTGVLNDLFLVCFLLSAVWIIYSFEKVYRPADSRKKQFFIAVLLGLLAVYTSDIVFYLLYRFLPAHV